RAALLDRARARRRPAAGSAGRGWRARGRPRRLQPRTVRAGGWCTGDLGRRGDRPVAGGRRPAHSHRALATRGPVARRHRVRAPQLGARDRLATRGGKARESTLALAVQPFQVSPPAQSLNAPGGVSPIRSLAIDGGTVSVDGRPRVFAKQLPGAAFATSFDGG